MSTPTVAEDRAAGYRPTVGIILLHHGRVLIGRESGTWSSWWKSNKDNSDLLEVSRAEKDWEFGWKIPQGGIEAGETVEEAFFREIKEELDPHGELLVDISKPEIFRHERQEFPLTRDGVRYRGKSYHYYTAHVQWIGDHYDIWVHGPNGDDEPSVSCPFAPAFRGGIYFADYTEAQELLTGLHQGRTTTQALRVIHELYARNRLEMKARYGLALTGPNYADPEPIDYPLFEADHPDDKYNWRTGSPVVPDDIGEPPLYAGDHPDDYFYKEPPFDLGNLFRSTFSDTVRHLDSDGTVACTSTRLKSFAECAFGRT